MKEIRIGDVDVLTLVTGAIAKAVHDCDMQVVCDDETLHAEEVFDESFIRGYVIRHSDYNGCKFYKKSNDPMMNGFQTWLAEELYKHVNEMARWFYDKGVNIECDKTLT